MADVFISYKREEKHVAQRLHDALEQFGFSVWFDVELLSGAEFRPVIVEMIDKCSAVVVLWSPQSVRSQFVIDEASYAQRQGKLCPALLEPCEIPFGFGGVHADSLEGWTGQLRHEGFNRLLGSIERLTGKEAQLGASTPESARERAEITAFQAAAKLRSAAAWKTFLKDYPGTSFRRFIESQIRELQSAAPAPASTSEAGISARRPVRAAPSSIKTWNYWMFGGAGAVAVAALGVFSWIDPLDLIPDAGLPAPEPRMSASSLEPTYRVGQTFRDTLSGGGQGPEMVVVPSGSFTMGSPDSEAGRDDDEGPQRSVRIGYQFAVGKYEVTWAEWEACVADGGCLISSSGRAGDDEGWGKGSRPVINVSWEDAQAYVQWLSRKTGERYRLLSEAEWEYVARAGTTGRFSWGDGDPTCSFGASNGANFRSCSSERTEPVGFSTKNGFGLHDLHGNVWEWTQDCYSNSYSGAPTDGSARIVNDCWLRVIRGGSWSYYPLTLRSANRYFTVPAFRSVDIGFRVARTL